MIVQELIGLGAAFLGSLGYAVQARMPARLLAWGGLLGLAGWAADVAGRSLEFSAAGAVLVAALVVGLLAEALARRRHLPATVLMVPAILPLVPGLLAFHTMEALVHRQTSLMLTDGMDTLMVSGAIALGIALATSLARKVSRGLKP